MSGFPQPKNGGGMPPVAQQMVLWGDSITVDNNNTGAGPYIYDATGYWTWASVMLGHRFQLLNIAGHSGFTTAQLIPTLQADVLAYAPAWVLVEIGINDITNDVASATTIANLKTIFDTLRQGGIWVVATTLPPSVNLNTTARRTAHSAVNAWIRSYCQANNSIVLADWYSAIADPTTFQYVTNYSTDGVHPSPQGAYWMGRVIAQVLAPITSPTAPLPTSNQDPANQIVTNPMMNGNAAGIATSWSWLWDGTAATVAHSKVTRTDGVQGDWQQAVVSGAPTVAGHYSFGPCLPASGWAVGDTVFAITEFELDPGWAYFGVGTAPVRVGLFCHGGAAPTFYDLRSQSSYVQPAAGFAFTGVLRTQALVVPASTDQLYLQLFTNALGTVRFGRSQIFKVAAGTVYG